jgi:DNA-binding GntR family transcriptional regulator
VDRYASVIGGLGRRRDACHRRGAEQRRRAGRGPRGSRESTGVIHALLRSRILSGELAAGSEISQARVAKECGVSRGPVREAFRLLVLQPHFHG